MISISDNRIAGEAVELYTRATWIHFESFHALHVQEWMSDFGTNIKQVPHRIFNEILNIQMKY